MFLSTFMDFNLRRILRIDACSMLPSAVEKAFGFFVKICLQALSTRLLQRLYIEIYECICIPYLSFSLSLPADTIYELCRQALCRSSIRKVYHKLDLDVAKLIHALSIQRPPGSFSTMPKRARVRIAFDLQGSGVLDVNSRVLCGPWWSLYSH